MRLKVLVVMLASVMPAAAADVLVEGDIEILKVLDDACRANMAKFKTGRYRAIVEERRVDFGLRQSADVVVTWDGQRTLLIGRLHEENPKRAEVIFTPARAPLTNEEKEILDGDVAILVTPDEWVAYYGARKMATRSIHGPKETIPEVLRVRPDEAWFKYERNYRGTDWTVFLAIDRPETLRRIAVVREGPLVRIHRDAVASMGDLVFDFSQGGNLTSYNYEPTADYRNPGFARNYSRGEFTWKNLSDIWVLTKTRFEVSFPDDKERIFSTYDLEVRDFSPDPPVNSRMFSFEALPIPGDAKIDEFSGPGKHFVVNRYLRKDATTKGKRQSNEPPDDGLDDLAGKLRKAGLGKSGDAAK